MIFFFKNKKNKKKLSVIFLLYIFFFKNYIQTNQNEEINNKIKIPERDLKKKQKIKEKLNEIINILYYIQQKYVKPDEKNKFLIPEKIKEKLLEILLIILKENNITNNENESKISETQSKINDDVSYCRVIYDHIKSIIENIEQIKNIKIIEKNISEISTLLKVDQINSSLQKNLKDSLKISLREIKKLTKFSRKKRKQKLEEQQKTILNIYEETGNLCGQMKNYISLFLLERNENNINLLEEFFSRYFNLQECTDTPSEDLKILLEIIGPGKREKLEKYQKYFTYLYTALNKKEKENQDLIKEKLEILNTKMNFLFDILKIKDYDSNVYNIYINWIKTLSDQEEKFFTKTIIIPIFIILIIIIGLVYKFIKQKKILLNQNENDDLNNKTIEEDL
jgi:hypothetical protein